jgi:hypothetical protein
MKEIKCRVLYRVPINIDLLDEFIEIGRLFEKRKQILTVIKNISDVSWKLRFKWMKEYNKEWYENLEDIIEPIRRKLNLEDEKNVVSYELGDKELIVVDILKTEYKKICVKYNYMVNIICV